MNAWSRVTRQIFATILLFSGLGTANAQTAALPANYKTVFENKDILVMRVHYGPKEFVPMHDHSAFPTVYIYLNNSGEVAITHEPPNEFKVVRPPTHTGAFRISPSMAERHSVTNLSDIPSDFLRVEIKTIPLTDIKQVFRSEVPSSAPDSKVEFSDSALKIDRIVCPSSTACAASPATDRSLLVALNSQDVQTSSGKHSLQMGDSLWLSPAENKSLQLSAGAQSLRVALLYPE